MSRPYTLVRSKQLSTTAAMLVLPESVIKEVDAYVAELRDAVITARVAAKVEVWKPTKEQSDHAMELCRTKGVRAANQYFAECKAQRKVAIEPVPTRAGFLRHLISLGLVEYRKQQAKKTA